ncbi:MAG TPA: hypothetical protein PKM50_08090 [Methanoregula sp.]|nr:hypothetical protein [Methanoregula sp.]
MANDEVIGSLWVKIGLDSSGLIGGLASTAAQFDVLMIAGQTALGALEKAFDLTVGKAEKLQEEIQHFSNVTGMSTDATQKWRSACIATGTSFDSLTSSLTFLNSRITDTGTSGDELRQQMAAIGISVKNLNGDYVDSDTLLQNILIKLNEMPSAQEKDAAAREIFGRSWSNLADMINDSDKALKSYQSSTPAFSQQDLKNIEECKNAWASIADSITIAGARIGSAAINVNKASRDAMVTAALADPNGFYSKRILEDEGLFPNGKSYADVFNEWMTKQSKEDMAATNAAARSTLNLTDRFKDLDNVHIELIETMGDLADAEKNRDAATNQADYDDWCAKVQTYKNKIDELTESINKVATATKTITYPSGWSDKSIVGSPGSEERSFMMDEMNNGADYQTASDAWRDGAHSYSNAGDFVTAGFNYDSSAFLAAGGSQEQWDLIFGNSTKSGSGTTGSKTAVTPGSVEQTKSIQSEYDSQEKALQKLTGAFKTEYDKQGGYYKDFLNLLTVEREKNYPILETLDLTHWATSEEIARVAEQKMLDFMATAVNFGGQNPIIQNMIVVSKDGPDWTPPAFVAVTAPKLTSADFSSVGASVQAIVAKGMGDGVSGTASAKKAASDAGIVVQQTFNGVDLSDPDKIGKAAAKGVNRALAGVEYIGGSMI